jgi:hypothetical protein
MRGQTEVPRVKSENPHGFYSFTVYLMTRSVAQNDIIIVNNELEWIRKEVIEASFEIQSRNLSEGTDNRGLDRRSSGRDLDPETHECEEGVVPIRPIRSYSVRRLQLR